MAVTYVFPRPRVVNFLPQIEHQEEQARREARRVARREQRAARRRRERQMHDRIAELEAALGIDAEPSAMLTEDVVMDAVCAHFDRPLEMYEGPQRWQPLAAQRQIAMWLMRDLCGASYQRIGDVLGGRDHTTILHGCRQVERMVTGDWPDPLAKHAIHLRDQLRMRQPQRESA